MKSFIRIYLGIYEFIYLLGGWKKKGKYFKGEQKEGGGFGVASEGAFER
jgi:hypothetical protein